jgi:hypothetical protein
METRMRMLLGSVGLIVGTAMAVAGTQPLVPAGAGSFRWRDIADTLYSPSLQSSYNYNQAAVTLINRDLHPAFAGRLVGSGLKPNFAYQVKLEGKPSSAWGADGDDWANEQLGYAGRWWMEQVETASGRVVYGSNSTDTIYAVAKALGFHDASYTYVFKGYLLFDAFVTTAHGAVPNGSNGWSFSADNSFHVLWKTAQRTAQANDSLPTRYVLSTFPAFLYGNAGSAAEVAIYGEWEPTRALPEQLLLPDGPYTVRFILTEESFHSTLPQGGTWASALAANSVSFTIATPPPPGALGGTVRDHHGKAVARATVRVIQDRRTVAQTLSDTAGKYRVDGLTPGSYTVSARAPRQRAPPQSATVVSAQTTTLDVGLISLTEHRTASSRP